MSRLLLSLVAFVILTGIAFGAGQVPQSGPHPALFIDAAGVDRLRVRLEREAPLKARWTVFLRNAEHCLTDPVAGSGGQWDRTRVRKSLKVCALTAFAYVMTGERRFGDRAKAELWPVLSATRWFNAGNERFNKGADLSTADGALITALVYDWCHDLFSEAEKTRVREAIQRLAFDEYATSLEKPDWWVNNPVTNWAGVCHGGVGLAALAFSSEMETARVAADSAWTHASRFLDAVAGVDGAGHEGVMYFTYGASYALRFVDAYARASGDDGGVFDRMNDQLVGYWLAYLQGPDGRFANFNNMNEHTQEGLGLAGLGDPPTGGPNASMCALLESHTPTGDRLLRWCADHGGASYITWGPEPWYFLWRSERPEVTDKPRLDAAALFRTAGHAVFRSDRLWLAFNGGWVSDRSHSNFDLGSLVLVADGERFVNDPGYGKTMTGDHSTVLVNGRGHYKGASATTLRFGSEEGFHYVLSDLSEAYEPEAGLERFRRHVLMMVGGEYVVLLDELVAASPRRFEWRLQTKKSIEVSGAGARLLGDVTDLAVVSAVDEVTVSRGKGALDYVRMVPDTGKVRQTFVTVLAPVGREDALPVATFEDGTVAVTVDGRVDRIVFEAIDGWTLRSVNEEDASKIGDGSERTLTEFRDVPRSTGDALNAKHR